MGHPRRPRRALASGLALLLGLVVFGSGSALYLPGLTPVDYAEGDPIDVLASKVSSNVNKVPYDYLALPFCHADPSSLGTHTFAHAGLGVVLAGERRRPTGLQLLMLDDAPCTPVCEVDLTPAQQALLVRRVNQKYRVQLTADGMPAVTIVPSKTGAHYDLGYPVGESTQDSERVVLNTHLDVKVMYHRPTMTASEQLTLLGGSRAYRVVGFQVEASSGAGPEGKCKTGSGPLHISSSSGQSNVKVIFTYTATFSEAPDLEWATRWDPLLNYPPERISIQWFALSNGILLGLFMTFLIALILLRTLYRDFLRYGKADDEELQSGLLDEDAAAEADSGWKLLRADVFRPPPNPALLSITIGTGSQLVAITLVTLGFALLGLVSPAYRGSFLAAMIFVWVLTSSLSGFVAVRIYRVVGGHRWKSVAIGVGLLFPSVLFIALLALNTLLWILGSIGAAPIVTVILLLFLWLGISVPLAYVGGFLGQKRKVYDFPVRSNAVPRPIPLQPLLMGLPMYAAGGALPFGVICIELLYIMNSIWQNEIYSMFGFLLAVFLILLLVCAESSVVIIYLKLTREDYRWWWSSFWATGSSALYVFMYSIFYLFSAGELDQGNLASYMVYLSYMGLFSGMFAVATGSVGFLSSFWFVRKIYSAIRAD